MICSFTGVIFWGKLSVVSYVKIQQHVLAADVCLLPMNLCDSAGTKLLYFTICLI